MNREEIRDLVLANIGNRTDKDTIINSAINLALTEIGQLHDFRAMRTEADISIAADDVSKALPSTTHQLIEARLIDGTQSYALTIKTKLWFVKRFPNVSAGFTGKPIIGYVEGNVLYFHPKSNDAYTVRLTYSALPAELSDDVTDVSVSGVDMAIVCWVTGYMFTSMGQPELAAPWNTRFANSMAISIAADKRRHAEENVMDQLTYYGTDLVASPQPWLDPFSSYHTRAGKW